MRKTRFVTGIVLGISLAIAVGRVEAKEKQFHANIAGTQTNKDDFSFTGASGNYATVAGKSTLGPYTAQKVLEASPDGKTCTLPGRGSGVEFVVAGEVWVLSFDATGEQLFLTLSPNNQLVCPDPTTSVFTGQLTFEVSGGTGRFAGATGTIVETFQFIGLAPPPPGG